MELVAVQGSSIQLLVYVESWGLLSISKGFSETAAGKSIAIEAP